MKKKLLLFCARYCGKCLAIQKRIKLLQNKDLFDLEFEVYDVDVHKKIVQEYFVEAVPTAIIIEDGSEVKRVTGSLYREDLLDLIK